MRLSLPSVAILSILSASTNAFAPPTPTCTSSSTRLNARAAAAAAAGNELSGLLNEYSGSSSPKVTAEKVADAVTSTVTTTPPPPLPTTPAPPAEVAESGMDSIMKAASAAQDAADQAAAAAAALTAKGAAATKAAAVAGTSAAAGIQFKAPAVKVVAAATSTKLPFQVDPAKLNSENAYDASARARENLAILKANLGLDSLSGGASGDVKSASPSLDLNLPDVQYMDIGPAVNDFIASLHLQEYGGWYVAAAMAIIASQQRSAGMEVASGEFESELAKARETAGEAASAAGVAAEGAKTAQKLAMKMEKDMKKDGGQALLESSRSKMKEMEKDMMEKEMRELQAEVASLRSQLEVAQGAKEKKTTPKTKTVQTEIEKEYPTKVIVDSGNDEDGRIIELLKEIDEDNKKKKMEEAEKKREEEAKYVAAQKKAKAASKKMTKGVEAAQAKAEVAAKKKATKKAKKSAKTATKAAPKAAPKTTTSTTKASSSTETKSSAVKRKATTPPKTTKTAVTKKQASSRPAASATPDDWASLAESTLKRKTVAQLSEYLTGKGVTTTDGSGKPLKKAELLTAVKSL